MVKFLRTFVLLMFSVVVQLAFVSTASAQVGGTQMYCNGAWLPPGYQCNGNGGQIQQPQPQQAYYQQRQQPVYPQAAPVYVNNGGGQVITRPCTAAEQASRDVGGAIKGAIVGTLIGDNHRSAGRGAAVGIIASELSPCVVRETVQTQGQIVGQQQLQQVSLQQIPQGGPSVTVPARCDFGDGVVAYTYEGQRGCDKLAAKMSKSVPAEFRQEGQAEKQQVASLDKHHCASGKEWKRLNWEGHPQHGQFICLPEGDPHRFEGE